MALYVQGNDWLRKKAMRINSFSFTVYLRIKWMSGLNLEIDLKIKKVGFVRARLRVKFLDSSSSWLLKSSLFLGSISYDRLAELFY